MYEHIPKAKSEQTWYDFARVNITKKIERNEMTHAQVCSFIKKLGKRKRGGILRFQIIIPMKYEKFFPDRKIYKYFNEDPDYPGSLYVESECLSKRYADGTPMPESEEYIVVDEGDGKTKVGTPYGAQRHPPIPELLGGKYI